MLQGDGLVVDGIDLNGKLKKQKKTAANGDDNNNGNKIDNVNEINNNSLLMGSTSRHNGTGQDKEFFSPDIEQSVDVNSMASAPFMSAAMRRSRLEDESNMAPGGRCTAQSQTKERSTFYKNLNSSLKNQHNNKIVEDCIDNDSVKKMRLTRKNDISSGPQNDEN